MNITLNVLLKTLLSTALMIIGKIPPELLEKTIMDFIQALISKIGDNRHLVGRIRTAFVPKDQNDHHNYRP